MIPSETDIDFDTSHHGVFIDVFDIGVMLTGPSGIGKSEIALSLLNQQHKLIADDCVYFKKNADGEIVGFCPPMLQDFIEVRGLGILNVRSLFGDQALINRKRIDMLVHIEDEDNIPPEQMDRLYGIRTEFELLGQTLPKVTLPVAPGRNLAILVEVAVRNQRLINSGYVATDIFMARQQRLLGKNTPEAQ